METCNYIAIGIDKNKNELTGSDSTLIIKGLKTNKGAVKRALSKTWRKSTEYVLIYRYTNIYDKATYTKIGMVMPNNVQRMDF